MRGRFQGLGVSPGIAVGRVHLLRAEQLPVVPDPVPPERVGEEIERFHAARGAARAELEELKRRVLVALGDHYTGILDAQLWILDDESLVQQTIQRIRIGRVSARWALKEVVDEFGRRFAAMHESHLREKGGDLHDVHLRLQRLLRGPRAGTSGMPGGPLVVVAQSLTPSDAIELSRRGVAGLASDVGGRTSHTAILAQALSVPAVAGLREMSQHAREGDPILLDGRTGEVVLLPSPDEIERAERQRRAWIESERRLADRPAAGPVCTRDGVEITLRANVGLPAELDYALRAGARGIGLYRSEFLYLTQAPDLPSEQLHYETYRDVARAVAPHPAVIRTLDLGGERTLHEVLERREGNPVLGVRALRFCLERPDIFRPQLRGLLRAAVEPNLRILLPLVTDVDEVRQVRELLREEARALAAEGLALREDAPLGVMIEVPAAAMAADALAREVDFLSLGTNDLIQYALAVDRGNEAVSHLYRPQHLGVLRLVRFVVEAAGRARIPLTLCGEMAADPEMAPLVLGLGLRELSIPPRAIAGVAEAVRSTDAAEAARETARRLAGGEERSATSLLESADPAVRGSQHGER